MQKWRETEERSIVKYSVYLKYLIDTVNEERRNEEMKRNIVPEESNGPQWEEKPSIHLKKAYEMKEEEELQKTRKLSENERRSVPKINISWKADYSIIIQKALAMWQPYRKPESES